MDSNEYLLSCSQSYNSPINMQSYDVTILSVVIFSEPILSVVFRFFKR